MAIVLIDQYPLLRLGLIQFLSGRFNEHPVSDFESIESFYESGMKWESELIILGVNGRVPDGILTILKSLMQRQPSPAVLIFDEKIEAGNALRYLNAGARGYLLKSNDMVTVEEGIREALKGERYIIKDIFDVIFDEEIERQATEQVKTTLLTPSENEIANYLIKGARTKFIAETLKKKESTISTFKARIFKKFNVGNVIELREKMRRLKF